MAKEIIIKDEVEKKRDRNINKIKKAVGELKKDGLKIVIDKEVETMMGLVIDNVYVVDKLNDMVIYQKHLFTC